MQTSIMTPKGQATIPLKIRKTLGLKTGDKVVFEVKNHVVIISKLEPLDYRYHKALSETFAEWSSQEDETYNDL